MVGLTENENMLYNKANLKYVPAGKQVEPQDLKS